MELTLATIAFIVISVLLLIVLCVEYIEYRRYRRAAQSVIAFGEAMQVRYNQVIEVVQNTVNQGNKIRKVTLKNQKGLKELQKQQLFTSMALNSLAFQAAAQQGLVSTDGEDSERALPGA